MSYLPSIVALSAMAVVALGIAIARGGIRAEGPALRRAVVVAILAILAQIAHFGEELAMDLSRALPGFFGLQPMPDSVFVAINLVALAVWALCIPVLAARHWAALFPLWFLAVASVANAVLHPLLALAVGGYFPGVWTAPLVGLAGVLLLRSLSGATSRGDRVVG